MDNGRASGDPVDLATARALRESTKLAVCAGTTTLGILEELDSGDFTVIDNQR